MARSRKRKTDRTSSRPEVLVELVRGQGSLRSQVESALRRAVGSGSLHPAGALPSSRVLARELGVSRGVVVGAYEQLIAEGFLVSRPRGLTAAAPRLRRLDWKAEADAPAKGQDFKPGVPDVREFPRREWSRATRSALRMASERDLGYGDVRGSKPLRTRLTEYLGRARAVDTCPAQILICAGVTQALGLAAKALAASGITCVAVEDPSQPEVRHILAAAGATVVSVPVDEEGLVVEPDEDCCTGSYPDTGASVPNRLHPVRTAPARTSRMGTRLPRIRYRRRLRR